jgi:hypothetical protein
MEMDMIKAPTILTGRSLSRAGAEQINGSNHAAGRISRAKTLAEEAALARRRRTLEEAARARRRRTLIEDNPTSR